MKLMTETQLLDLLAKAYDQGHFDGTGPQAVTTEHRDTYEWHQACAQIRKAIYSAPAAQRLEVQALQRQGCRPQAITGAGIGLSRGNDHRVVCADGSTQRGVGASK